MDSGSKLQPGITAPVLFVCSWGQSQWDSPQLTTSHPPQSPPRYPADLPCLLPAFSFCTDVTAAAREAKQSSEPWSTSRSMRSYGGLRESPEKNSTGSDKAMRISPQKTQLWPGGSEVPEQKNTITMLEANTYFCFLKLILRVRYRHQKPHCPPEIQRQVMTSGMNSARNFYLKGSCSHPSPKPCPRASSFCIKANGRGKPLPICRRQVQYCQVYDKKNPLTCPPFCGLPEDMQVSRADFKCTATYTKSWYGTAVAI